MYARMPWLQEGSVAAKLDSEFRDLLRVRAGGVVACGVTQQVLPMGHPRTPMLRSSPGL